MLDRSAQHADTVVRSVGTGTALDVAYSYRFATVDVGSTPLGFRESNVVGGIELAPELAQDFRLRVIGERRAIVNSVLSYAGAKDPVSGRNWGGVVRNRGNIRIWYTDDARHMPVMIQANLFWGTIIFRLQSAESR